MGLFDSLFSGLDTKTKLSPQESFAGILLAASACDGHISEDEFSQLLTSLFRMKLFRRINEKQFDQVMNKLMGVLKKHGADALADGCVETLPDELHKSAFANACNIMFADGVVDDDEKEFMNDLSRKLALDPKVSKTIVRVMVIKNKG